jgi:hypothetical protein
VEHENRCQDAEGVHHGGGNGPPRFDDCSHVRAPCRSDEPAAIATSLEQPRSTTAASSLTNLDWPWKRALMLDMRVILTDTPTRRCADVCRSCMSTHWHEWNRCR